MNLLEIKIAFAHTMVTLFRSLTGVGLAMLAVALVRLSGVWQVERRPNRKF